MPSGFFVRPALLVALLLASGVLLPVALAAPPSNDARADAILVEPGATVTLSTVGATREPGEAVCPGADPGFLGATVWFKVVPSRDGWLRFDTFGSSFDTVLAGWYGSSNVGFDCNDEANGTHQSLITLSPARAGEEYLIQVGGFYGRTGNLVFHVSELGEVPSNNDRANAAVIAELPALLEWSTLGSDGEPGDRACEPWPASTTDNVWFVYTSTSGDVLTFDTNGSNFPHLLSVWRLIEPTNEETDAISPELTREHVRFQRMIGPECAQAKSSGVRWDRSDERATLSFRVPPGQEVVLQVARERGLYGASYPGDRLVLRVNGLVGDVAPLE